MWGRGCAICAFNCCYECATALLGHSSSDILLIDCALLRCNVYQVRRPRQPHDDDYHTDSNSDNDNNDNNDNDGVPPLVRGGPFVPFKQRRRDASPAAPPVARLARVLPAASVALARGHIRGVRSASSRFRVVSTTVPCPLSLRRPAPFPRLRAAALSAPQPPRVLSWFPRFRPVCTSCRLLNVTHACSLALIFSHARRPAVHETHSLPSTFVVYPWLPRRVWDQHARLRPFPVRSLPRKRSRALGLQCGPRVNFSSV